MVERSITNFLDNEYKQYSFYVVENRACPSLIDGFKTGARKIMHASFKGSLKGGDTKKVTNLAGETMNYSLYQHGDSSLNSTIITLSQEFNFNINPLFVDGQNGSLRSPDAASPRYLYVRHSKYIDLFKVDSNLLEYEEEEGQSVEPKYYLPIIPLVLCQRQEGMAPGYRFSTMSYNPIDIIDNCIHFIKGEKPKNDIRPYVRGIKTYNWKQIIDEEKDAIYWENRGEWSYNKSRDIMIITDLPYDIQFDDFEKMLNKYVETGYIKAWQNFSSGNKINYSIQFESGKLKKEIGHESSDTHLPNKFKLIKRVPNDNLWVVDENKKIRCFLSPNELTKYFVDFRLNKYNDRKKSLIIEFNKKLKENSDLCKFIKLVIEGKIKINNRPRAEIKEDLKKYELPESMLSVPISKLTKEEYEALLKENEEIQKQLEYIKKTSIEDMYLNDLKELKKKLLPDFPDDTNPNEGKDKFIGVYKEDEEKVKLAKQKEKEKKKKEKEKLEKQKEKDKKAKEKEKLAKEKEKLLKQKEKEKKAKEKEKLLKQKEKERKVKEREKKAKEKEKLLKQKEKLNKAKKK